MWCAFALHPRPALGMGPAMGGGAEASPTDSPPTAAHREPAVAPPFATPLVIRPPASAVGTGARVGAGRGGFSEAFAAHCRPSRARRRPSVRDPPRDTPVGVRR